MDNAFHLANSKQPHTMPNQAQFTEQATKLGIKDTSLVIIYDNQGVYSAPRAWWMFKCMGLNNVFVLDGGLPAWLEQGFETKSQYQLPSDSTTLSTQPITQAVFNKEQVLAAIDEPNQQIVDARGAPRFNGTAAEPRPGLRSGHIPSAINLHFAKLLVDRKYRDTEQIKQVFSEAQLDKDTRLVVSCGSGMTACIVLLAAHMLGFNQLTLYDGSWSEWGADESLPVET